MSEVFLTQLCSKPKKVFIHPSEDVARKYVNDILSVKGLTYDGSAKLVLFRDDTGRIRALLPENKSSDLNENTRLIDKYGAVDNTIGQELKDWWYGYKVPRQSQLIGTTVIMDDLVISYDKYKGAKIGKYLYKIFGVLKAELANKNESSKSSHNPDLRMDLKKLTEIMSNLGIGQCDNEQTDPLIRSGYIYITEGDEVFEYAFAENKKNDVEWLLMKAQEKNQLFKEQELYASKTVKYHRWAKFLAKTIAVLLAAVLALVAGGIFAFFLTFTGLSFLPSIGGAVVGVVVFLWNAKHGITQINKENQVTIENGVAVFRDLPSSLWETIKKEMHAFVVRFFSKTEKEAIIISTVPTFSVSTIVKQGIHAMEKSNVADVKSTEMSLSQMEESIRTNIMPTRVSIEKRTQQTVPFVPKSVSQKNLLSCKLTSLWCSMFGNTRANDEDEYAYRSAKSCQRVSGAKS